MTCPICRGDKLLPFVDQDEWHFSQCVDCQFAFLDPMPNQSQLNALYHDDRGITGSHYPKARSRRIRALLRALRLLPWFWRKSAFDLGCGGGFMVDAFRRLGARACGLDVNAEAIAYARRVFPRCQFLSQSFDEFQPATTFDFVYSSELIEHISTLEDYMAVLRRLTHSGSHVYITTPDLGSNQVPQPITDWDVFAPPHHVQFFNEQNLALLFQQHGFAQVRRYADQKAGLKVLFRRLD